MTRSDTLLLLVFISLDLGIIRSMYPEYAWHLWILLVSLDLAIVLLTMRLYDYLSRGKKK